MKLSFIIPAYNEEVYIGQCLKSLLEVLKQKNYPAEIIVINNASTDATKKIASSFPGVKVVDEFKKGLTRARQKGLETATGDWLAYLDADTRMSAHWIDIMEQAFRDNKKMVCLSGPYRYYDTPTWWHKFVLEAIWKISAPLTYFFVGYMVLGGNFVAKKKALIAMGGFDTTIEFYGEDTDIARRISKFGKSVFRMDFYILSSCRRFVEKGLMKVTLAYAANFIWQVILHKPFNNDTEIRFGSAVKAFFVSLFFALAGCFGAIKGVTDWKTSLPLVIFYAILIINTFFSIRCFNLVPFKRKREQHIIDTLLAVSYLLLATSFRSLYVFALSSMVLYVVATFKYILLFSEGQNKKLLRRKIFIDALGISASILALGGILMGFSFISSWIFTSLFFLVNVYIFFIKPLYSVPLPND